MFNGIFPALITPFKNGNIDFDAMGVLIEKQIAAGVSGFVLLGTTAETPALTKSEKEEILKYAAGKINKRVKIIIGAGSNNTATTLENIETALKYNPDALLIVTPYYNKPNLSGMTAHFKAAEEKAKGLPIILYHIPGRTGQKLSVKFLGELLAAAPSIKGIKESDYDIAQITEIAAKYGDKLNYICGNDDLWPVFLGLGCNTIISAAGNSLSPSFIKIKQFFDEGKTQEAMKVFRSVFPLIGASYFEVNPTCAKYILEKLGYCSQEVRLPLGPIAEETKQKIDALLKSSERNLLI